MQTISGMLYEAAVCGRRYHASPVEKRVCKRVSKWQKANRDKTDGFYDDFMRLLSQYEEQGFALGLQYGISLAQEMLRTETL